MLLSLYNQDNASANPSALVNLLPGGANTQVSGSSTAPMLGAPRVESVTREVIDNTSTNPATNGQALVLQAATGNTGGANYIKSASANQAVGQGKVGIISSAAAAQGGVAEIVTEGPVMALATSTANTSKAIAVGDPLCLDGSGNLTSAPASPAAGTVVATALQALAGGTSTATSIAVHMGGY